MPLSDNLVDYWPLTSNNLVGAVNGTTLTALNMEYEAASPGPAWRRNAGGVNGYLQVGSIALAPPFTLAVMCYSVSSGDAEIFSYTKNGNDNNHRLYRNGSNKFSARTRSGGTAGDAATVADLPGNQFNNVAGVWAATNDRRSYLADTLGSAETTNLTPTGSANILAIGAAFDGSTIHHSCPENFRFKHAAVWSRALTDAELDSFFANPGQLLGPAAPVLSAPTVVSTGNGIATVRVTTDTAPSGSSTLAVRTRAVGATAWTAAEVLAAPTATITSGASGARDFNLTGLTNGTALAADFAQTGPSNVVSTGSFTPSTVPGAPTIGTATAGNAQATVNGTAPGSTGGSAITGYRSTATPGGSTVTGASLPITHTGLTNGTAYTFTLAAQNANGYGAESAASNSVTPSAPGTAPNITVQPSNQTVTAGATATFSVTATGSGLTYQWRRNGTNISGATSSGYTTPATTVSGGSANNGDLYSVVVTGDTAPAATSSNATLTVNAPAPPPPPPPPPSGPTLPAVATDATGSARRLNQTTRMIVEPFTSIEALGTGARTIVTGTTDATTGEITLTGLAAGTYAVFGFFPSTGATINGVRFRLVTVT